MLYLMMIMILSLTSIMMLICFMISKKTFNDREKNSPFECGFDPKTYARLPFTLHFFLIAIIFLIFDIEITLLIPIIYIFYYSNIMNFFLLFSFFILILLYGLYYEWYKKALSWTI
uniref:NADH dehydrogenase subunit 3 n=1 Tax=Ophrygonius sp. TaxID=2897803 RepID=UPI001EDE14F9|nr:NADH dehydrogenase subunit 3 [Ophrygonius sp.]UFK32142.1 NADH dehydrogenase subunit 3 [Ophrygonius sp.]UIN24737.1 NADH dehydrogenase subunit 3 [Ophrygonius sp.]